MLGQIVYFFIGPDELTPLAGSGVVVDVVDAMGQLMTISGSTEDFKSLTLYSLPYNSTPTVGCWCLLSDFSERAR